MTLALLLTAVGGAWAEEVTNKIWKPGDTFNIGAAWMYDDDTSTETVFHSIDEDNTVPAINAWTYDSSWNQWKIPTLIKVDKVDYSGEVSSLDFSIELALSAPEGKQSADVKPIGFKIISGAGTKESPYTFGLVYEEAAAEPTEWSLTPDETGKTWTLANMPASNIELQVEYYAESNLFLGKDALADKANIAVKNGETTVEFGDDGKSTTTVTEGNTVTAKFTGKKVLGMKVEKKSLLSINITGPTNATIYYFEGETWEQAIQNHPTENSAWSIDQEGHISCNWYYLYAGDNLVNSNDTIAPNAGYRFPLS